MTKNLITLLIVACVALQAQVLHADMWQDLAQWKLDKNWSLKKPCVAQDVEQLLVKTDPAQYGPLEDKLIKIVASPQATLDARQFCCRMLQRIGTEKCVPVVAKLLPDEKMSHYACLVLGRMPKSHAARAALIDAVGNVPAKLQLSILGSIGNRGNTDAIGAVSKLTSSSDVQVASIALHALGRIGSSDALKAIMGASTSAATKGAQLDAMLNCCETLGNSEAAPVYRKLFNNKDEKFRSGGLVGLLRTAPAEGIQCMVTVLKGEKSQLRQSAIACVVRSKNTGITPAAIQALAGMSPAQQAEVIEALGARGDRTAAAGIVPYLSNSDATVRDKAIRALGLVGGPSHVKTLLNMMNDRKYGKSAFESLATMTAPGTDDALIAALSDAALAGPAARTLGQRVCQKAAPALLKLAASGSPASGDAWRALASTASKDHMDGMMKAVLATKDRKQAAQAQKALKDFIASAPDKAGCFKAAAGYYDKGDSTTKAFILEIGSVAGGNDALNLARKALKSGDKDLATRALKTLSSWIDASPGNDLLELAKNGADAKTKILALRGYFSLIPRANRREQPKMCKAAQKLVKTVDDKRQLISCLAKVQHKDAIAMLTGYLADDSVKSEAQRAAVNLCKSVRRGMAHERKALINKVINETKDKRLLSDAKKTLKRIR